MKSKVWPILMGLCVCAMFAVWAAPARAQMSEVKEKPRLYSYVAFWTIPRPQWADEEKLVASEIKLLDKGVSDGSLVGYGSDQILVHQPDGPTHDTWFSAMSMAGLLNVLDTIYKSGMPTSPVDVSATKHWDGVFVSRYYNWHPGSWKDAYTYTSEYKLKADAPNDAVDTLSKNLIVPILEKLLADGTLHEYEIDTEAVHTQAPGTFYIVYIAASADGVDKVSAAIRDAQKENPLATPAFGSMIDYSAHRDYLSRTSATYK